MDALSGRRHDRKFRPRTTQHLENAAVRHTFGATLWTEPSR